jgi:YggT family protein
MTVFLIKLINIAYWAFVILIFARILMSWVNIGSYQIRDLIFRLTEPILAPVRRLLPARSGIDLSPMIVLFAAYLLYEILIRGL